MEGDACCRPKRKRWTLEEEKVVWEETREVSPRGVGQVYWEGLSRHETLQGRTPVSYPSPLKRGIW